MTAAKTRPGPDDYLNARRRFLTGVARGDDVPDLLADGYAQHPPNNTFPGEVYLAIGAEALALAGCHPGSPLPQDGLLAAWLPEMRYRGRNKAKIRFAIMSCAARAGGLEVDLLDEVIWWGTDDYYQYAACAALTLIRAGADRLGMDVAEFTRRLSDHTGAASPGSPGVVG